MRRASLTRPEGTGGANLRPGLDPLAEQRGSDADHGRAFLDGYLEVARHAHAQVRQRRAQELLAPLLQLSHLTEHWPYLLWITRPRRHGHKTLDFDPQQRIDAAQ